MKCYILMGSPRKNGNTAALLEPFIDEMEKNGVSCETDWLYDMDIKGCVACLHCQHCLKRRYAERNQKGVRVRYSYLCYAYLLMVLHCTYEGGHGSSHLLL